MRDNSRKEKREIRRKEKRSRKERRGRGESRRQAITELIFQTSASSNNVNSPDKSIEFPSQIQFEQKFRSVELI